MALAHPAPVLLGRDVILPGKIEARLRVERNRKDWVAFRRRWIHRSGRVIDSGNRGISHSEGQGTGLLFAPRNEDRAIFDRILEWTRGALRRPSDQLHSWRYTPDATAPVDDPNNASDGDLLITWGLLVGYECWGRGRAPVPGQGHSPIPVAGLYPGRQGERLLLPGAFGFMHADHIVVNPSYWLFGALLAMEKVFPDPAWAALRDDGMRVIRTARFGRWGLPPDWLRLPMDASSPTPASPWPHRFSWDAVRVPLHLVWGGHERKPAVRACANFWGDPAWRQIPAWADLATGAVAPYAATGGILAVAQLAMAAQTGWGRHDALPTMEDASDYYTGKLTLMAHFAWDARDLDMREEPRRRMRQRGS